VSTVSRQRDLKAAYKREPRPMGVYVVRNTVTKTGYLGASVDLDGILNRRRFEVRMGSHMNKALEAEMKAHGAEAFAFEVTDRLEPKEGQDDKRELAELMALRLEVGLAAPDGTPLILSKID
jgi:hypothetical protein